MGSRSRGNGFGLVARWLGFLGRRVVLPTTLALLLVPAGCAADVAAPLGVAGVGSGLSATIGSGNLLSREMSLGDFAEVEAHGSIKVDIVQSETYAVAVTADDNLFDSVEIVRQGQTLELGYKPGSYVNATLKVRIGMPNLRRLSLSGASSGTISGFKSVKVVDISLTGASKLVGRLEADDVRLVAAEASGVTLGGTAGTLALEASGASEANLGDLYADTANTSLRGASKATVNVKGKLDADVREASNLYYVGNPLLGSVNSSGGSWVKSR